MTISLTSSPRRRSAVWEPIRPAPPISTSLLPSSRMIAFQSEHVVTDQTGQGEGAGERRRDGVKHVSRGGSRLDEKVGDQPALLSVDHLRPDPDFVAGHQMLGLEP